MKTTGNFHFSATLSNLTMLQTNTKTAQTVQSIVLAQQLKRSSAAPTNHNNSIDIFMINGLNPYQGLNVHTWNISALLASRICQGDGSYADQFCDRERASA
jgi:hypothetical protein